MDPIHLQEDIFFHIFHCLRFVQINSIRPSPRCSHPSPPPCARRLHHRAPAASTMGRGVRRLRGCLSRRPPPPQLPAPPAAPAAASLGAACRLTSLHCRPRNCPSRLPPPSSQRGPPPPPRLPVAVDAPPYGCPSRPQLPARPAAATCCLCALVAPVRCCLGRTPPAASACAGRCLLRHGAPTPLPRRRRSHLVTVQHFQFSIPTFCSPNFNISSTHFQHLIVKC